MSKTFDYGLELTNNSKVGWAFSLPRTETCIGATRLCKRLCYGNGIRYQSPGQKQKRARNLRTVDFLLSEGGPALLAENLISLVDQARPRDYLTAKITNTKTAIPWTLRIHDIGDFYTVDYVNAWKMAAEARPGCSFWFYTRSFVDDAINVSLLQLASLANCKGFLSLDTENFDRAMLAKCAGPSVWSLAILQDRDFDDAHLLPALNAVCDSSTTINFAYHHAGRHVKPLSSPCLTNCPAIVGNLKLTNRNGEARPCQICKLCLPL